MGTERPAAGRLDVFIADHWSAAIANAAAPQRWTRPDSVRSSHDRCGWWAAHQRRRAARWAWSRRAPPPRLARPVPRGRPVGCSRSSHHSGLPVLPRSPCACVPSLIPRWNRWVPVSLSSPAMTAFPASMAGSASTLPFSEPAQRSLHVAARMLAESPDVTLYTESFSRFVSSTTAPIATGRSESCRVGLPPTGRSRLPQRTSKMGMNALSAARSREHRGPSASRYWADDANTGSRSPAGVATWGGRRLEQGASEVGQASL